MKEEQGTINDLHAMKRRGTPIACLTAYDATFARVCDAADLLETVKR